MLLLISCQIRAQRYFQNAGDTKIPSQKMSMGELSFIIEDSLSDAFLYASKIGLNKQNTVFFAPTATNLHQTERVWDRQDYEYRFITVSTPAGLIIGIGDFTLGFTTSTRQTKYVYPKQDTISHSYSLSHYYNKATEYQWFAGYTYGKLQLGVSRYSDYFEDNQTLYSLHKLIIGATYSLNTKSTLSFDYSFSPYYSTNYRLEFSTLIGKETKIAFIGESIYQSNRYYYNYLWNYTLGGGITSKFSNFLLACEICYKPEAWERYNNIPSYYKKEINHNWEFKLGVDCFIYSYFDISAGINYLIENRQQEYQNPIDERVKDYSNSPGVTAGLNYKLKNFDFKYIFVHHTYEPLLTDAVSKDKGFNNNHFLFISYNF